MKENKVILLILSLIIAVIIVVISLFIMKEDKFVTVYFDTDGGSLTLEQIVESGELLIMPEDPVKDGYTFIGWSLNDEIYNFENTVTNEFILVALWEEELIINLNENYEVVDYTFGTLCWNYSYPLNATEVYTVDLDGFHFSESEEIIISSIYEEELSGLNEEDKEDFIYSKWDEVNSLHELLVYDYDKVQETYEKLLLLEENLPKEVVNYSVNLDDYKITYFYDYLEFSESDEDLYNKFKANTDEFNDSINDILADAFYSGGGCGDYIEPVILDEELCDKYNLVCDRW